MRASGCLHYFSKLYLKGLLLYSQDQILAAVNIFPGEIYLELVL